METKHLRMGVVQIDSRVGDIPGNLAHAGELVEEAARQRAQIVLLPELMPSGYTLTEAIWDYAEPFRGPTVAWLSETAKRHNLYLGTTFLEADGEDFYNTFALAAPDGTIAGKVRKSPPASLEAFFYRAGTGPHVIETALGRIGVAICFEGMLFERLEYLYREGVDLVLQPAAAGRLMPMRPGDTELFDDTIQRVGPVWARALGTPVAYADRTGDIRSEMPAGLGQFVSTFPGYSQIVDSDGTVKVRMGSEEEGVAVAEVEIRPDRRPAQPPQCYEQMWSLPMPWFASMLTQTQQMGEQSYAANPRRPGAALGRQL